MKFFYPFEILSSAFDIQYSLLILPSLQNSEFDIRYSKFSVFPGRDESRPYNCAMRPAPCAYLIFLK
jgi:hypothetical protein